MFDKMSYDEIYERTQILSSYDILINDEKEVLVCLKLKVPGEPSQPLFYYEGGMHGILVKNESSFILCDYLNPGTHQTLSQSEKVLFVEMDENDEIMQEYEAELIHFSGINALGDRLIEEANNTASAD